MKIKELAATRVRYGYRRIHVLLGREGEATTSARIGFTAKWACNCAIKRPLRPSQADG